MPRLAESPGFEEGADFIVMRDPDRKELCVIDHPELARLWRSTTTGTSPIRLAAPQAQAVCGSALV